MVRIYQGCKSALTLRILTQVHEVQDTEEEFTESELQFLLVALRVVQGGEQAEADEEANEHADVLGEREAARTRGAGRRRRRGQRSRSLHHGLNKITYNNLTQSISGFRLEQRASSRLNLPYFLLHLVSPNSRVAMRLRCLQSQSSELFLSLTHLLPSSSGTSSHSSYNYSPSDR